MYKRWVSSQLKSAGLSINQGKADPKFNISVYDPQFYKNVAIGGSLGFGESYADNMWDCSNLDDIIYRVLESGISIQGWKHLVLNVRSMLFNMQNKVRSMHVAEQHYDVDTKVFEWMLDSHLQYTCGYWDVAQSLDEAQIAKMNLIIQKLGLKAGDRVLDIGCGWGGFAKYAAKEHGIKMYGLSISKEQLAYARRLCYGLDCTFKFGDYRYLADFFPHKFDAITIIGVTEHIGYKNYEKLYAVMRDRLKPDGLVLQHSITQMRSRRHTEPFIDRYIFPGGVVPSVDQLSLAMRDYFVLEDVHNFGADYDKTLMAWHQNIGKVREEIEHSRELGKRFYRVWEYYLLSCAAMFRSRHAQLMQFVLSPNGVEGGYRRVS